VSPYRYERLSAQDNGFLRWEKPNLPMHGGATQIFRAGPLATPEGGIDFETLKRGLESILHLIPRYRQKLAWLPAEKHAVWVDDPHFSLDYHMRHTALPRPGSDAQLKQLAARIMERPVDLGRPPWEIWVVEGLRDGRFAAIAKMHHCMVDGVGGVDLASRLMSTTPAEEIHIESPPRFVPRALPSRVELLRDEGSRLLGLPLRAARGLLDFVRGSDDPVGEVAGRLRAIAEMARYKLEPVSETPLNGPVGPHRIFDWLQVPLDEIKAVRKQLGCSVNDVVLGIVTGAVREFLIRRQSPPDGLVFRVATPVSVRREEDTGRMGNRVSTWVLELPLAEPDPRRQIALIHEKTRELKASQQASVVELLEAVHEWIPIDVQALSTGTQNMFVTNVPGPQVPFYMLGAELLEIYVHPPLIENLGLVVGVMSYNGRVCWGLVADYDRVPDVADFAALLRRSFERIVAAARPAAIAAGALPTTGAGGDPAIRARSR
jgi:diacylglycerol O-acyltransferase